MAKILLAEDDNSMRSFLATALERAGHSVVSCADGLCALDALDENPQSFDLLLTDIVMPGLDGIHLSQKATERKHDLKILFITGFSAALAGQNITGTNARLILKPFPLKALMTQVDEILHA